MPPLITYTFINEKQNSQFVVWAYNIEHANQIRLKELKDPYSYMLLE